MWWGRTSGSGSRNSVPSAAQKSRSARTASRTSLASTPSSRLGGFALGTQPHAACGAAAAVCTLRRQERICNPVTPPAAHPAFMREGHTFMQRKRCHCKHTPQVIGLHSCASHKFARGTWPLCRPLMRCSSVTLSHAPASFPTHSTWQGWCTCRQVCSSTRLQRGTQHCLRGPPSDSNLSVRAAAQRAHPHARLTDRQHALLQRAHQQRGAQRGALGGRVEERLRRAGRLPGREALQQLPSGVCPLRAPPQAPRPPNRLARLPVRSSGSVFFHIH